MKFATGGGLRGSKIFASPKRRKYGNKIVVDPVDGTFHSEMEYKRWKELQLLERAGEIKHLQRQVRYSLVVNDFHVGDYVSDFDYFEMGPYSQYVSVAEDVKGVQTPEFKLKQKLMWACHKIKIRITGKSK